MARSFAGTFGQDLMRGENEKYKNTMPSESGGGYFTH